MANQSGSRRHDRTFAQAVRLTPPPTHKQFAAERVRARIKTRAAGKKLGKALDRRAETVEQDPRRVNPLELARVWNSLALRELRDCLTQPDEDKLYARLAAYMAGETTAASWCATINALAGLRRAAEPAVGAPRRWRQTWAVEQEW
jgi:hypothetical protein